MGPILKNIKHANTTCRYLCNRSKMHALKSIHNLLVEWPKQSEPLPSKCDALSSNPSTNNKKYTFLCISIYKPQNLLLEHEDLIAYMKDTLYSRNSQTITYRETKERMNQVELSSMMEHNCNPSYEGSTDRRITV
jgi:hypothetical protein